MAALLRLSDGPGFQLWDLESVGYVAEEYALHGAAPILEPVSIVDALSLAGRDDSADALRQDFERTVVGPHSAFATRVIIYRPKDVSRISGNAILEVLHPGPAGRPVVFETAQPYFIASGDIMIGVQHPMNFATVRAADEQRYGFLAADHPSQLWSMIADAGRLARMGAPIGLPQTAIGHLLMTGRSFTGAAAAIFANSHHHDAVMDDGRPVFDGYFPLTCGYYVRPRPVPVMRLNTQSDFSLFGLGNRTPDSDAPDGRHRLYEVAGGAHFFDFATPVGKAPDPVAQPGMPQLDRAACIARNGPDAGPNDLPIHLVVAQLFEHLKQWVRGASVPPTAPRIEVDQDGNPVLDMWGNTCGGLRLPELLVPRARYGVGEGDCRHVGHAVPFGADLFQRLYADEEGFRAKYNDAVRAFARHGWMNAASADARIASMAVRGASQSPSHAD